MSKALHFALLTSVCASAASAADLPSRKPAYAPLPVLTSTWDGSYFGVNAGYTWTQSNSVNTEGFPGFGQGAPSALLATTLATTALQAGNGGGFAGGGQVGYNKQFGSFVVGWESDLQLFASGRKQAGAIGAAFDPNVGVTLGSVTGVSRQIDWLATSRVRAGFLVTPNLLLYATGGTATGGVKASTGLTQAYNAAGFYNNPGAGSYASTRVGYTLGGGAEWMFAPNWSVKAEYLYYDLGRATYGVTPATAFGQNLQSQAFGSSSVRFNGHLARLGFNYHWDWWTLAPKPAPSPQYAVWNGFYVGMNIGYGWSQNAGVSTIAAPSGENVFGFPNAPNAAAMLATFALPGAGSGAFSGGVQAGVNRQVGAFVLGWETDLQAFGSNRSQSGVVSAAPVNLNNIVITQLAGASRQIDWLSTSRARIGFLVTPTILLYGTAGFASGGVKASTNIVQTATGFFGAYVPVPGVGSYGQTRVGYTLGGGAEWAFAQNWSVKAEYLYYDLGRASYAVSPVGIAAPANGPNAAFSSVTPRASTRFNGSVVRAGLNYHWNWDPAPALVAKY
ncbi:MAG: outer membrane beta-barrel protein [Rhodoblastus sp.]